MLEEARMRFGVPGAALGLLRAGETTVVASGVASLRTGLPVLPDTLFPVGSVGKVHHAALLVSLGLDLDVPVRAHLPGFSVADPVATETVTLRHLLTHSSGIESDHLADFGRGADAVERYVASCATLGQLHPPGLLTTYCNAGFGISGRVIEVATGMTWDDALRARLLAPAGLVDTVTLPEEAILRPFAVGHQPSDGGHVVTSSWSWPHAFGPTGGTMAASAGDLLAFAGLHLRGRARVLDDAVVDAMQELQRPWPDGISPGLVGMGLGWLLYDWDGRRVLGHNGAGMGAHASLRVVPELDAGVAVLTNAVAGGQPLTEDVLRTVFREELGIEVPGWPPPVDVSLDEVRYAGTYRRLSVDLEIVVDHEGLVVRSHWDGVDPATSYSVPDRRPTPVGSDAFVGPHWQPPRVVGFRFVDVDGDGRPDYLYEDGWAHRRVD